MSPAGRKASPVIGRWVSRAWSVALLGLCVVGLGGVPLLGTGPADRHLLVVYIPAGVLLALPAPAMFRQARGRRHAWVLPTAFLAFGVALVGIGLGPIVHGSWWQLLTIPAAVLAAAGAVAAALIRLRADDAAAVPVTRYGAMDASPTPQAWPPRPGEARPSGGRPPASRPPTSRPPTGAAPTGAWRGWCWVSLIPLGLGAWAPIGAGWQARRTSWMAWGALCSVCVGAGWVLSIVHHGNGSAGGFLILIGWIAAVITSFAVRRGAGSSHRGDGSPVSPLTLAQLSAEERIRERDRARDLAREHPDVAREMGLGRPDLHGSTDALNLVDVNNAPVKMLTSLPGVDAALASRIDEARRQIRGFQSLEDMGSVLDLDGALVEGLRSWTIFLPRPGAAE